MNLGEVKTTLRNIKFRVKKSLGHYPKVRVDVHNLPLEKLGSDYGGWIVLQNSLSATSIVYSFGIGYDFTFDAALIEKYGCHVYAFDPTENVLKWLGTQTIPANFHYKGIALYDNNETLTFYSNPQGHHFNHSKDAGEVYEVKVKAYTVATIMKDLQHKKVDLVKLDIEGSEYKVIDNFIATNFKPNQLLIEFHHFFTGNSATELAIEKLRDYGYKLFAISPSYTEYSFVYSAN